MMATPSRCIRASHRSPPGGTFDSELEDVVAVLDAVLHVAAVDARVIGPQLGEQQGRVGVALVEDGQGGAEPVILAHLHPVPTRYQDLHLLALGDEGPLDPRGPQHRAAPGAAAAAGGLGAEVGDEAGDGDVARQHSIQGWLPWDGDLQSLEVLWEGEERSREWGQHGVTLPYRPRPPLQGMERGCGSWCGFTCAISSAKHLRDHGRGKHPEQQQQREGWGHALPCKGREENPHV